MAAAIEIRSLTKRFDDVVAVDAIDLDVDEGEFLGFLGPNGAGKSTTIRMLTGLLRPDAGSARVCGHDVVREPLDARACLGMVPEELQLYTRLTPREYVEFVGTLYGMEPEPLRARTGELLELLGLAETADRLIVDCSHGMQKKTALAAAIVHTPRVLFLDEPFQGIDTVSRRTIREVLEQLRSRGTTIFFSSHILEVVERLCSRVVVIASGRIVADGTVEALRRRVSEGTDVTLEDVFMEVVGAEEREGRLSWLD